jgi:hypothetical protein
MHGETDIKFISVVGYFGLDSVLQTEGSILDPGMRSHGNFANNYVRPPSQLSVLLPS